MWVLLIKIMAELVHELLIDDHTLAMRPRFEMGEHLVSFFGLF